MLCKCSNLLSTIKIYGTSSECLAFKMKFPSILDNLFLLSIREFKMSSLNELP